MYLIKTPPPARRARASKKNKKMQMPITQRIAFFEPFSSVKKMLKWLFAIAAMHFAITFVPAKAKVL
jgi:hypothetical protein